MAGDITLIAVLRRCGQVSLVYNSTGNAYVNDVLDVQPDVLDDIMAEHGLVNECVDDVHSARDAALDTWYRDINCLCCKHNTSMRLELSKWGITVLVECDGTPFTGSQEAFSCRRGEVHHLPVTYCYPEPLTPWEIKKRLVAAEQVKTDA